MDKKISASLASLIFIIFCIAGCDSKESDVFPSDLAGTWVTKAPRYANRTLEINDGQIIFGTGGNEPNTFFINRVKKGRQASPTQWTFFCEDIKGNPFEIVIFHTHGSDSASIALKHKEKILWYKINE